MRRDDAHLLDIVLNARAAMEIVGSLPENEFASDRTVQGATMYHLMLMGEAASKVSQERQSALSKLPWREMIGLRNRLIHDYQDTRLDIVWRTVREELPQVVVVLERLVGRDAGGRC